MQRHVALLTRAASGSSSKKFFCANNLHTHKKIFPVAKICAGNFLLHGRGDENFHGGRNFLRRRWKNFSTQVTNDNESKNFS